MQFYKRLTGWAWVEIITMIAILVADISGGPRDGLWLTLLIAGFAAAPSIIDEIEYSYSFPVNHPAQRVTDKAILANLIRSWISLFLCLSPIIYGPIVVKVLGVLTVLITAYAILASHRLYSFIDQDVKYEG